MFKKKTGLAVMLVAVMIMGSTFTTAAAAENSGNTRGAGTSEGHVEKKITNVELPTVSDGNAFDYTIDPERLIQETQNARYEDYTFPTKSSDTGVYFLTADKVYGNESKALTVTNKSSHDIDLTVTAKASTGSKDIALTDSKAITGSDPQLYLGLKSGSETKAVNAEGVSITTSVKGKADNFETRYVSADSAYKYVEKDNATGWATTSISMEGACNEADITSDLTAPTVDVTWKFEETPTDVAPSVAPTSYTMRTGVATQVNVNLGAGSKAATSIGSVTYKNSTGANTPLATSNYTFRDGKLTIAQSITDALISAGVTEREYTIHFNNDETATFKLVK